MTIGAERLTSCWWRCLGSRAVSTVSRRGLLRRNARSSIAGSHRPSAAVSRTQRQVITICSNGTEFPTRSARNNGYSVSKFGDFIFDLRFGPKGFWISDWDERETRICILYLEFGVAVWFEICPSLQTRNRYVPGSIPLPDPLQATLRNWGT